MTLLHARKIKSFKLGLSLGCYKCNNLEEWVIQVMDGPKTGFTFLACNKCWEEIQSTFSAIPVSVN